MAGGESDGAEVLGQLDVGLLLQQLEPLRASLIDPARAFLGLGDGRPCDSPSETERRG